MSCWNAYVSGGSFRGVPVARTVHLGEHRHPQRHDQHETSTSRARRSYIYVKDGAAKSQADFDAFSLEASRNEASGHSFVSAACSSRPRERQGLREHLRRRCNGTFTATFNVSSLNNITNIYVYGSTGPARARARSLPRPGLSDHVQRGRPEPIEGLARE